MPHPHDIGTIGTIGAVSGSGPSDIWAIQGNTAAGGFVWGPIAVVHWDGSNWSAVDLSDGLTSLRSISARTRTDVWAVGAEIVHWDGKTWTRVPVAHATHALAAWLGVLPAAQVVHARLPTPEATVPAAQAVHDAAPSAAAKVPAAQATHDDAQGIEAVPAGQGVHVVLPGLPTKVPSGQVVH